MGIERRTGGTNDISPGGQCLHVGGIGSDDGTADHIGMSVEILGGRVNDEVRAVGDRTLQRGRQKGVVYRDLGADGLCAFGDRPDTDHAHERIARGLDEHEPR